MCYIRLFMLATFKFYFYCVLIFVFFEVRRCKSKKCDDINLNIIIYHPIYKLFCCLGAWMLITFGFLFDQAKDR